MKKVSETTPIINQERVQLLPSEKLEQKGVVGYALQPCPVSCSECGVSIASHVRYYNLRRWLFELQTHFGWRLMAILFVSQHISKARGVSMTRSLSAAL